MTKVELETLVTEYQIDYEKGKTEHDDPVPGASYFSHVAYEKYGPYYSKEELIEALCRLMAEKKKKGWQGDIPKEIFKQSGEDEDFCYMDHEESEYSIIYTLKREKVSLNSLPDEIKNKILMEIS
jgi:hypothetical protein